MYSKRSLSNLFIDYFGINCEKKIKFIPHHEAHISSSYFTSGFDNAVGLSIDGTGDFSSMEISYCKNNEISITSKNLYPHSLGIVYQACSFRFYGEHTSIFWIFEGEIYHNSLITNNNRNKKSELEKKGFNEKAIKQTLRQFRYIKFLDKSWVKKCTKKELPYLKHYNND